MTRVLVGCDVGGTFTDAYAVRPATGASAVAKAPTTPGDPAEGVAASVGQVLETMQAEPGDVARVLHGTTTATNAVLEHELATTAFVTNQGFQDLLEIGRQDRAHLYELAAAPPPPLVPRSLRFGVQGRLDAQGEELAPVDAEEVDALADVLQASPAQAVAVCLLHAHLDPAHEDVVAARLRARLPEAVPVVTSSGTSPEVREVERATTTVLNAALLPRMSAYLDQLTGRLDRIGIQAPVQVLDSQGALLSTEEAARLPVRTVLSGPAGGAAALVYLAGTYEFADLLGVDVGGTSTDVSLVLDGAPTRRWEGEIAGHRLQVPTADIHTVGAGGGSIAWLDEAGGLRVGPQSAGAQPGPACYGRGGSKPTVTDACLVLGRIPETARLGGDLTLDLQAAREAIAPLADGLGETVAATASAILAIAVARAARGIRSLIARQAADPEALTLVAFGGAGPLLATDLAEELGTGSVLWPLHAGVTSAVGLLAAPPQVERARSVLRCVDDLTSEELEDLLDPLDRAASAALASPHTQVGHLAAARYVGQSHELPVRLKGHDPDGLVEAFHRAHEEHHGYRLDAPVEVVTLRTRAAGAAALGAAAAHTAAVDAGKGGTGAGGDAGTASVVVDADGTTVQAPVVASTGLAPGQVLDGPAIVQATTWTGWVAPGWRLTVAQNRDMLLAQEGGR